MDHVLIEFKKNIMDFIKTAAVIIAAIWTVSQMNEAAVTKSVDLERRLTRIETLLEQIQKNKP